MARYLILAGLWALLAGPVLGQDRQAVFDRTLVTMQRGIGNPAGDALAKATARDAAGSPALGQLQRQRDAALADLNALRTEAGSLALLGGATVQARRDAIAARIAQRDAELTRIEARLDTAFPEFRLLTDPGPLTRPEAEALLRGDEALLYIVTTEWETYVWAIGPGGTDWHRADIPEADLSARVRDLRATLRADTARAAAAFGDPAEPRIDPFDRQTAFDLYTRLLAPLEPVFGEASHVMVVAHGPLSSLPLSVLVTTPPLGADDSPAALRSTDWLLMRHAVTTLPSLASLRALRGRARPDPGTAQLAMIGFGDPELGYRLATSGPVFDASLPAATITRGVYDDIRAVAQLAPLPGTRAELRALARTLGPDSSRIFLGPDATEARVKSTDLRGADIVVFATHGLLADELEGLTEPALVFTPPDLPSEADDALLTATEAAELDLDASLVILSACNTAASDGTPGAEGLSGLARAFLYAGTRALLVSHWPVDDRAAARLTTGMIGRMTGPDPMPRAEALRQSQIALLRDTATPQTAHPRLWAPFVVVGEGGADGG